MNIFSCYSQNFPFIRQDSIADIQVTGADSRKVFLPHPLRSSIPEWLNDSFPINGDTLFILGISDPGLQDTIARKQAFLRAIALGAMACKTGCDHFSDWYKQSKGINYQSQYEEIYRFTTDFHYLISEPKVKKCIILESTEIILLVGIPVNNSFTSGGEQAQIESYLYTKEADIEYGNKLSKKIDFSIQKKIKEEMAVLDAGSFYHVNGKATGIRFFYPNSQNIYNNYDFFYTSNFSSNEIDLNASNGTTCRQGLWIAYINQILEHLASQTKILCDNTASVTEKMGQSLQTLSRENTRLSLSWRINNIVIQDHEMRVSMTISKL